MLKKGTMFYFTDGSIVPDQDGTPFGCASFVKMERFEKVLDKYVWYSYPNIHYLESLAIYNALINIDISNDNRARYEIITDSDAVYYWMRKLFENSNVEGPFTQFEFQIYNIFNLLNYLLNKGFDIRLYLCKSHTTAEDRIRYFRNQNLKISLNDARFVCYGNSLADYVAYLISKDPQLFYKYIPSIVPSNWTVVV